MISRQASPWLFATTTTPRGIPRGATARDDPQLAVGHHLGEVAPDSPLADGRDLPRKLGCRKGAMARKETLDGFPDLRGRVLRTIAHAGSICLPATSDVRHRDERLEAVALHEPSSSTPSSRFPPCRLANEQIVSKTSASGWLTTCPDHVQNMSRKRSRIPEPGVAASMRTLQASGLLPRKPQAHGPADSVEAVEGPLSSPRKHR